MKLQEAISNVKPGDKFFYRGGEYLRIKTTPADLGCSTDLHHLLLAIDLESFEIFAFDNAWEVEVLN